MKDRAALRMRLMCLMCLVFFVSCLVFFVSLATIFGSAIWYLWTVDDTAARLGATCILTLMAFRLAISRIDL